LLNDAAILWYFAARGLAGLGVGTRRRVSRRWNCGGCGRRQRAKASARGDRAIHSVQSEIASTVTSNDAGFHFTVHKGKYHLTAQRRAQTQQSFGSHSLGSAFGVAIVVDSDQRTDNLVFRLLPPAAISGRVVDDAGEPVENALVQLLGSSVAAGRKRVAPRAMCTRTTSVTLGSGRSSGYLLSRGNWHTLVFGIGPTGATGDPHMAYRPFIIPIHPIRAEPRR